MIPLDLSQASDWLLGSLFWAGTAYRAVPGALEAGREAHRAVSGRGAPHLPLALAVDVAVVLDLGPEAPFASDAGLSALPAETRSVRLRYEGELLARILQEPGVHAARDAIDGRTRRAARVQALTERVLERLAPCAPRIVAANPAHLRQVAVRDPDPATASEAAHRLETSVGQVRLFEELLSGLLDAVGHRLQWSELLAPEDIFEVEHLELFESPGMRVGCRQILEVARRMGPLDPRGVPVAEGDPAVETAFVDESTYPSGGLAGLTTRGSLDSLVPSELVLSGEGDAIDLFDLRYLEGELLYFLRDEGELRRKRRTVHIVLDLGPAFFRKAVAHPVQLGVLAQALALRLVLDLRAVFSRDAVRVVLHYPDAAGDAAVARELAMMAVLQADAVRHGVVMLAGHPVEPAALADPRRKVYLAVLTAGGVSRWQDALAAAESAVRGLVVTLGGGAATDPLSLPLARLAPGALGALHRRLVAAVAGLR